MSARQLIARLSILLALIATTLITSPVIAQDTPPFLSHQGRLFGADNTPLSGPQSLTFRLYDGADAGASVLWEETQDADLSNGFYSVVLGRVSALDPAAFDGSTRYLGVTIGDATVTDELSPRLEVTSVAYALKASVAENATGALTPESVTFNGGGTILDSDGSVTVGGAQVAPDGQISLGAATINTDGSIVVGDTTINTDGSISVGGNPVISATGGVDASALSVSVGAGLAGDGSPGDPLVTTDVTLTALEAAGCTDDQVPQYAAATGWSCQTVAGVDTNTTYEAGTGLTMTGLNNTFSVDFGIAQQRVTGACAAGEAIQTINADGTVTCETDDDTTYAAGAGIDISAGTISLIDTVDDDTTYTAGTGINITGTTISLVDTTDDDTTYTAGTGLTLTGTQFDVDPSTVQARVNGTCVAGSAIRSIDAAGNVLCEVDDDADTQYTAGSGLTLAGTQFAADTAVIQARVTGVCPAGESIRAIAVDGGVTCEVDTDTTLDETTVEGFITNAPIDLAATSSVAGQPIATAGLGERQENPASSCDALHTTRPALPDGVYWVKATTSPVPFRVYCDMTTDGGGWTLVWSNTRYGRGKQNYNMGWNRAVNTGPTTTSELSTDLESFTVYTGVAHWADLSPNGEINYRWSPDYGVPIERSQKCDYSLDAADEYRTSFSGCALLVGGTNAGLFASHSGLRLTTWDNDNDSGAGNCSASYGNTPWWYNSCWSGHIAGGSETFASGYYNGAYWRGSAQQWATPGSDTGAGNGWLFVR